MKRFHIFGASLLTLLFVLVGTVPATAGPSRPADIDSDEMTDSVNMAVGTVLGANIVESIRQLNRMGVPVERKMVAAAINAYLSGEPTGFTPADANIFVDSYISANASRPVNDTVSIESQEGFLETVAATDGAIRNPSGLVLVVEQEGEGVFPGPNDIVTVEYEGRLSDGSVFDRTEGQTIEFPVSGVVPGFAEGLMMMKPGGRYRIVFPASLGYGPDGIPGAIPGNAALDFTVTLHGIKPAN